MYAVLAEGDSDALMLRTIIERLSDDGKGGARVRVKEKGYCGSGELYRIGARDLKALARLDFERFVVCFDADRECPKAKRDEIIQRVVKPAALQHPICVLIPIQEIESWILADLDALGRLFPHWRGRPKPIANPESIQDPKEHLRGLTSLNGGKPKYDHANHNQKIAIHLDLAAIERKCASFRPLLDLVRKGEGNAH